MLPQLLDLPTNNIVVSGTWRRADAHGFFSGGWLPDWAASAIGVDRCVVLSDLVTATSWVTAASRVVLAGVGGDRNCCFADINGCGLLLAAHDKVDQLLCGTVLAASWWNGKRWLAWVSASGAAVASLTTAKCNTLIFKNLNSNRIY
jgi:hypothetical protein